MGSINTALKNLSKYIGGHISYQTERSKSLKCLCHQRANNTRFHTAQVQVHLGVLPHLQPHQRALGCQGLHRWGPHFSEMCESCVLG